MKYLFYLLGLGSLGILFYRIKDLLISWNLGRLSTQVTDVTDRILKRDNEIKDLRKTLDEDIKRYEQGIDDSIDPDDTVH